MFTSSKPHRSSSSRSRKPPSFLDDLAFTTVATPEERKKLREKRRERSGESSSRASSSREERKHRNHAEARDGRNSEEVEVRVVEDSSAAGDVERRRRGGFSRERLDKADMGYSTGGELEKSRKPFGSWLGGLFGKREAGARRSEADSDPWDTAQESVSGGSYTVSDLSSKDKEDFDSFSDALKKVSLREGRDKGKGTKGSWRRDHRRRESPSRRHSSEAPRPRSSASRDSPPGGWPSSSGRFQISSQRTPPPFEREARPIEEMFRTGMTGHASRRRVPRSRDASRSREKERPPPSALLPLFPNPETIAPRNPKKGSSRNRHLKPGVPLTEENVAQHTYAGGGQKSYGDKSRGWEGCKPGGESEGSEGSLWCDGAVGELEPWDSLSCHDYRY